MAQANAALPDEPNKVTQVIEWVNQLPGVAWGVAVFAVAALAVAAVAVLTGNLDKIFSFFSKYFGKAETKLSEEELSFLRQQLLKQMTTDVAQRLEDSLHNLVRVDLQTRRAASSNWTAHRQISGGYAEANTVFPELDSQETRNL